MEPLRNKGFTDKPTENLNDDQFDVGKYIDGLAEFLNDCDTPMTVAIQGDWGSGKTSMMNMVKNQLGDKVVTLYFNTWQYSQFNMGDQLSISFLSQLINMMDIKNDDTKTKSGKLLNIIKKTIKTASLVAVETVAGGVIEEKLEDAMDKSAGAAPEMDLPTAIKDLKEEFQKCVNETINEQGKGRMIIFVDDLDRLNPGKAVELLEVLKLFLDCENCVFVLAIDYAVVSQGVKEKYGDLIGEEKGKSFFDKIIQVPFKMPVAMYKVNEFVKGTLDSLEIDYTQHSDKTTDEQELDKFVSIIQRSITCNPRAMKRLFNSYVLLNKIYKDEQINTLHEKRLLFGTLCMQQAYEKLYNYVVRYARDFENGDLLSELANPDAYRVGDGKEESRAAEIGIAEKDITKVTNFVKAFIDIVDEDGDGNLDPEEMSSLMNILRRSKVTASEDIDSEDNGEVWELRRLSRWIVKRAIEDLDSKGNIKIYQGRTEKAFRFHWAAGYVRNEIKNVGIEFDCMPELGSADGEVKFRISIYAINKIENSDFAAAVKTITDDAKDYIASDNGRSYEKILDTLYYDKSNEEKVINEMVELLNSNYMTILQKLEA